MTKYMADGEVYSLWKEAREMGNRDPFYLAGQYEYCVWLMDESGSVIDEWDSQLETRHPNQPLTKAQANRAIKEVVDAVAAGEAENWFTLN